MAFTFLHPPHLALSTFLNSSNLIIEIWGGIGKKFSYVKREDPYPWLVFSWILSQVRPRGYKAECNSDTVSGHGGQGQGREQLQQSTMERDFGALRELRLDTHC